MAALYQAFYRTSSPNLINLFATVAVFFLVIYLQGFKVNLKLAHKKYDIISVSYTHLDVYKRQVDESHSCIESRNINGIGSITHYIRRLDFAAAYWNWHSYC